MSTSKSEHQTSKLGRIDPSGLANEQKQAKLSSNSSSVVLDGFNRVGHSVFWT